MNRIILVGNGFDLAHGLRTSYKSFLDDYWKDITERIKAHREPKEFKTDELVYNKFPHSLYKEDTDIRKTQAYNNIGFDNLFLKHITDRSNLETWVDIENEYYRLLKNSFKYSEPDVPEALCNISTLNKDFKEIQKLLIDYLAKQMETFRMNSLDLKLQETISNKIYSEFEPQDFTEDYLRQRAIEEFKSVKNDYEALMDEKITMDDLNEQTRALFKSVRNKLTIPLIRQLLTSRQASNFWDLYPNNILFLNFNYTLTELKYVLTKDSIFYDVYKKIKPYSIHIHGTIEDLNSIIFGFGDEIDDDYKTIENLNDNKYLDNIKSIRYLNNGNYKKLLEFINSEEYQIFIFGHSCGISDRTLLNTLFEHRNCISIKPFYHKKKDETDTYSDIVKNISRNFNDKISMRDKVVNKEYCEPLTW